MNDSSSPNGTQPADLALLRDTLPEDLPPADLSENARIVLARRYLKKDEKGRPVEEPEQMFWRVARVIAEEDAKYGASAGAVDALAREFYRLMTQRLFEPNSATLYAPIAKNPMYPRSSRPARPTTTFRPTATST